MIYLGAKLPDGSRTLSLVLSGHWYNKVLRGEKNVEYRAMIPHWTKRIWMKCKIWTHVAFYRGYTTRILVRRIKMIDVGLCPYRGWDGCFYRIHFE